MRSVPFGGNSIMFTSAPSVTRQVLQSLPFGELYFLEYLLETI